MLESKGLRTVIALGLLLLLTVSIGCSRTIKLHPVTDKDIYLTVKDGDQYTCVSDYYLGEVMRARLEQ